jgi:hypothetical protein
VEVLDTLKAAVVVQVAYAAQSPQQAAVDL